MSPYLRNFLVFLVVAGPVSYVARILLDVAYGALQTSLSPVTDWLTYILLDQAIYTLVGGALLTAIHTKLIRRASPGGPTTTIFRSVGYAGLIALLQDLCLYFVFVGILVLSVPGALVYGLVIGRTIRNKTA